MNSTQPSILIIYTGGTIGMVNDPYKGSLVPIDFQHISDQVPELKKFGFRLDAVSIDPVLDSSDIEPGKWVRMADVIKDNYYKYDGFVFLHGTDTMAYSASALSFMLENLEKPVIFTGSQLPIGVLRTDGKENLITSIEIAAARNNEMPAVPEVCIYFDKKLMRANRTTKNSAEQFEAFSSPNYPVLAEAGLHIRFNWNFIRQPGIRQELKIQRSLCTDIAVMKLFPGINYNFVKAVVNTPGLKGLIIETFGSGNAPTYKWFIEELASFINRGGIILNVTQCHGGAVEMGLYETSRELLKAGVISGRDITSEAAVTKLMYLFGRYDSKDKITDQLGKSIAGEITADY
ncbi:MAG: asparaginase [Bacteroidales bacterium]